MYTFTYIAITILGAASYIVGVWKILKSRYSPSVFSRVVWVLLTINSFAGVILSKSSPASVLLGAILLAGNAAMCIVSFSKGTKEIGKLEYVCLFLLAISVIIWVFFRAPLVNLGISLFAHFIGAAPTYKKVWRNPASEDLTFWVLFFLASLLSVLISDFSSPKTILLPLYYTFFEGSMVVLVLRGFYKKPFLFSRNFFQFKSKGSI